MKPIEDFLFNPNPDIGGALVPIIGPQGSGKTVALTQIGLEHLKRNHLVMWRGTKQAQWAHFLANDVPVTLWNHDTMEDFEAFIPAYDVGSGRETIDIEDHNVQVKNWSDPSQLIEKKLDSGRVNVVNVPGIDSDTTKGLYFFRKTHIDIRKAMKDRKDNLRFITDLTDEGGDLYPCQQQLRKPFYRLIVERIPPILAQMRKQNVFKYVAAHATHDLHYFVWKIKSSSIMYMSNAVVKKSVSPQIKQEIVGRLARGEFVMPPKDKDHFELPELASTLDWIPDNPHQKLRLDWEADIPDLLNDEEDSDKSLGDVKKEVAANLYRHDELDLTQQQVGNIVGLNRSTVSLAVNNHG